MDILQQYVDENKVSQEKVLEAVDEYSLYSFYIGQELELNTKYSSPLRLKDDDPSFALYYGRHTKVLLFKDNGTGHSGNIFKFLTMYLGLSYKQVVLQINSDFQLGFKGMEMGDFKPVQRKKIPVIKEPSQIRVTSQPNTAAFDNYWKTLDITQSTLDIFFAKDTGIVHYITKSYHKTIVPKTLCISYEIWGYYKIYQPLSKRFKFTNNYPTGFVEGAIQLRWNLPFAIITKASKECMFFREHFDWDAVAGTSENSMINHLFMLKLLAAYPVVFIWLDNDAPGIRAQAKYLEKYPQLKPIIMNKGLVAKDVTDLYLLYKKQGREQDVLTYSRKLINTHLSNGE
jgi:hypothetical protein